VSLNSTLSKIEKVKYHIKIMVHKLIVLRFWIKSGSGKRVPLRITVIQTKGNKEVLGS